MADMLDDTDNKLLSQPPANRLVNYTPQMVQQLPQNATRNAATGPFNIPQVPGDRYMNGYGMTPGQIHHNEYVNGAMGYSTMDRMGALNFLNKLGHPLFDVDHADMYHNDTGSTVYFFKNGKAFKSVDLSS